MPHKSIEETEKAIKEREQELKKIHFADARYKISSDSTLCRLKLYLKYLKKHQYDKPNKNP